MNKYQLNLSGLSCNKCVNKVKGALDELDDTKVVDLNKNYTHILSKYPFEYLCDVIQSKGYDASNFFIYRVDDLDIHSFEEIKTILKKLLLSKIEKISFEQKYLYIDGKLNLKEIKAAVGHANKHKGEFIWFDDQPSYYDALKFKKTSISNIPKKQQLSNEPDKKNEYSESFLLSGMSCASCVSSVEAAIYSVEGVDKAYVNLSEQSAQVVLDPLLKDNKLIKKIIDAVSRAGYQAKLVVDDLQMRDEQQDKIKQQLGINKRNAIAGLMVGGAIMLWEILGGSIAINTNITQFSWGLVGIACLILLMTAGGNFYRGAWQSVLHKRATMDTLIALGTGAAWIYSMLVVIMPSIFPEGARQVYFEASAMIIGLISLGKYIETKGKARTTNSLKALINLQPKVANYLDENDNIHTIDIAKITRGMKLQIRPGESIPVDGVVIEGESYIDESMITGEPVANLKIPNTQVYTGTINQNGSIVMVAQSVGYDTILAKIIKQIRHAQSSKPPIAYLVDRVSAVFVPIVIGIALLSGIIWWFLGPEPQIGHVLVASITVLIIACPCALGLATPLSITVGIGKAAELGVLVKDAEALQIAGKINTVVFDKTGTLTKGSPSVGECRWFINEADEIEKFSNWIAQLENQSEHPLAKAICSYLEDNLITTNKKVKIDNFNTVQGQGVVGKIDGKKILIGSFNYLQRSGVNFNDNISFVLDNFIKQARTPVLVAVDKVLVVVFAISDKIKDDSKQAIDLLHNMGINTVLLSGDRVGVARAVGEELGIDQVIAEVLPEQKADKISQLQKELANKIAMVGDGINDASALAQADVGIAMGSGSDISIENSGMTLLNSSPIAVASIIKLSQATSKNIKQNLIGAFIYNIICIPVAAGALYPIFGFTLNPMLAGMAMALSSITVVTNANRLRLFKI